MSQKMREKKSTDKKQPDSYDKVKRRLTFYNPTSKVPNKQVLTNVPISIFIDGSSKLVKVSGE